MKIRRFLLIVVVVALLGVGAFVARHALRQLAFNLTGQLNLHPRAAIKFRTTADKDDYVKFYDEIIADI